MCSTAHRTVFVRASAAVHRPARSHAAAVKPSLASQAPTSSSMSSRAASMVCRDAPRPMWAAKQHAETPKEVGGSLERMITRETVQCKSMNELSDVYNQWSNSFNYIHAAAAIVKCGKLPGGGRSSLVDKLCSTWLTQLPLSGLQQCGNVLWACVRLGPGVVQRLWDPTWKKYVELLQRESTVEGAGSPQNMASPLWACAKLRKQPSVDDLQLLMQSLLHPAVLEGAKPQDLSNIVWALGEMCQLSEWQGGVSEPDMQQLLGKQQLLLVCDSGRVASNVLFGLAGMAVGKPPIISVDFARDCGKQLLSSVSGRLGSWNAQDIANAMWACAELRLADTPFMAAAAAAAPQWVPGSKYIDVHQAAMACAALQCRDERIMSLLLQQGLQLLSQQRPHSRQGRSSRPLVPADRDRLAAGCCTSVAQLDMQSLAGTAVELVSMSGVAQQQKAHPVTLGRLWVFHSWLLQHQLLDGQGLTGLLTQQQLQQGAKEAAALGMC